MLRCIAATECGSSGSETTRSLRGLEPLVLRRKGQPKVFVEKEHVVGILLVGLVSSVTEHLDRGGNAAHRLREDSSDRETVWRIAECAAVRLGLYSTAALIEGDRVEVDAADVRLRHDETDRELISTHHKSARAENGLEARHVVQGHNDIEIFMP